MNKRLESLQEEARILANKIWNNGANMTHNELDDLLAPFTAHIYTTAVQDCRAGLPTVKEQPENQEGAHYWIAQNEYRTEADKALEALLP